MIQKNFYLKLFATGTTGVFFIVVRCHLIKFIHVCLVLFFFVSIILFLFLFISHSYSSHISSSVYLSFIAFSLTVLSPPFSPYILLFFPLTCVYICLAHVYLPPTPPRVDLTSRFLKPVLHYSVCVSLRECVCVRAQGELRASQV